MSEKKAKSKMTMPLKITKGMGKKKKGEVIAAMLKQDFSRFDDNSDQEDEGEVEKAEGKDKEVEGEEEEESQEEEEEKKAALPSHAALANAITSILNTKVPTEKVM
jgi:hypothetical protein